MTATAPSHLWVAEDFGVTFQDRRAAGQKHTIGMLAMYGSQGLSMGRLRFTSYAHVYGSKCRLSMPPETASHLPMSCASHKSHAAQL